MQIPAFLILETMRAIHLFFVLSFGLLISCASSRNHALEEGNLSRPDFKLGFEGVITNDYRDQGCAFLFEFEDDQGVKQIVRPMELTEEFKVDGLKVQLSFRMSRAMNGLCDLAHPVIVESIEKI